MAHHVMEVTQDTFGRWTDRNKPYPGGEALSTGVVQAIPDDEVSINSNGRAFRARWYPKFRTNIPFNPNLEPVSDCPKRRRSYRRHLVASFLKLWKELTKSKNASIVFLESKE